MKPVLLLTCAAAAAALPFLLRAAQPAGAAAKASSGAGTFKVHEWGTFTVLIGTDGMPVEWYQPASDLAELPSFVHRSMVFGGKSGTPAWAGRSGLASLRMETPVLYFYPDRQMEVSVTAELPGGGISEVFPPLATPFLSGPSATWRGTLLPPDSPDAALVPAAEGKSGRHYAAARAVPDAWLFRSAPIPAAEAQPEAGAQLAQQQESLRQAMLQVVAGAEGRKPTAEEQKKPEPVDHFIFYRGAGAASSLMMRADQTAPDTVLLSNYADEPVPHFIALRVRQGTASWTKGGDLKRVIYEDGRALHQQSVTFPAETDSVASVAQRLRAEMIAMLVSEGLTEAEAAAMVATWDDLWFTEPGTRILAVLPQSMPDRMVPLKLSPAPQELDRVFVARLELISSEQEQTLVQLLSQPADEAEARKQLASLDLGRFSSGAVQRAVAIMEQRMKQRFAVLMTTQAK